MRKSTSASEQLRAGVGPAAAADIGSEMGSQESTLRKASVIHETRPCTVMQIRSGPEMEMAQNEN